MPTLDVHLLEGFAADEVVVTVEGNVVARLSGVSTRQQIGLAKTVQGQAAGPSARVTVELPNRRLSASVTVDDVARQHVRAHITQAGQLEVLATSEPLRLA